LALKADRLSCHRFVASQVRLLLYAAADCLLDVLREKLCASGIGRLQLDTLRLRLIKVGGRVKELLACVKLHLASGYTGQPLWHTLATSAALSRIIRGSRLRRRDLAETTGSLLPARTGQGRGAPSSRAAVDLVRRPRP
jgi:hypothetical protein